MPFCTVLASVGLVWFSSCTSSNFCFIEMSINVALHIFEFDVCTSVHGAEVKLIVGALGE